MLLMNDVNLHNKRVLIRQDLNVPMRDGKITSDARLRAALLTLKQALDQGAQVMIMSHLGRPQEGSFDAEYSLKPVVDYLKTALNMPVYLAGSMEHVEAGSEHITVLENVRFNVGEKINDDRLAQQYASLCDVFVMDAFGTAHRAQASTHGVAKFAPVACAGPLLTQELNALSNALEHPARPLVAIVGGSKVSTKLAVLESLAEKVDQLVVGGGIANTFMAAQGHSVGKSLYESELLDQSRTVLQKVSVPMPTDVVVANEFSNTADAIEKSVNDVKDNEMILDIGSQSAAALVEILQKAGTIVWNGPVGVFEIEQFSNGTQTLADAIARSPAFSIAGGGDTLAAIDQYNMAEHVSYISTGGGAFLEFLEGKELPAVAILKERSE